jgi:tetratricopeptide (TPR) repeat protein
VTAAGVFAGIVSGLVGSARPGQLLLAVVGSVLPGVFAAWQTREQLVERAEPGGGRPRAPAQLPPDVADFTGRREQASRLAGLLAPPARGARTATPVVTVAGKGGVGKTALALHVAHRVARRFPDGQLHADLRGVEGERAAQPADVLAGFLRGLGVAGADVPESADDRARMYRALLAGRKVLVLLDNAADEAQVRPLIPGSAGCAVLVTGRSRLSGLEGGVSESVDVMEPAQALALLAKVAGPARVAADEAAAARIARLCGFLPLALRVAGARLASRPSWRLDWFADRLGDERNRLNLLKVGDMEVRASLALSYRSRDDRDRHAFRMLGLLRAGAFPAWNLAALTGADPADAEDAVEALVDAELLETAGVDSAGPARYRFHDLLRDYARERLAAEESEQARAAALRRLVGAYLAAAREASAAIQPGTPHTPADDDGGAVPGPAADAVRADPRAWLSSERDALVSLVAQAAEAGLADQAWRLAEPLAALFHWRADWRDWEQTHRTALDAAGRAGSVLGQAVIRCSLGVLCREQGRFDEAVELLTGAGAAFDALGDEHRRAVARRNLADAHRYSGHLDDAIAEFAASLEVFERYADLRSAAGALGGMGDALRGLSRWADAQSRLEGSLALYRRLGDPAEQARTTVLLAMLCRDRFQNPRALELLGDSLKAFVRLGDRRWEAQTTRLLGTVLRNEGELAAAVEHLDRGIEIFEELLDRRMVAASLRNRGDAHRIGGDYEHADADLRRALGMFAEIADRRWAARTRLSSADMHRRLSRWDAAEEDAEAALACFREIGDRHAQARALRELGMIARDGGRWDASRDLFDRSRVLFADLGDELWGARVLVGLARLAETHGDDPAAAGEAAALRERADRVCRRCGVEPARRAACLAEW